MKRFIRTSLLGTVALTIAISACKKETVREEPAAPDNPYDNIDYGQNPGTIPIDSATFLGIHKYIFTTTCAQPACHDGSFEPDYRTVQSAYNTLVYAPVINNNANNDFTYRVTPMDTALSWLHERITTDDMVLGRMPLYDQPLNDREVGYIEDWIMSGAPDIFGNSPILPSYEPGTFGILAFENDTTGMRLDTIRQEDVAPIELPQNTTVQFWVGLYDQDVDGNWLPAFNFSYNKYKLSNNLLDFSGSAEQSLTVENALTPFMGPVPGTSSPAPYYHSFTVNTADFPVGQSQYVRVYVQDADHTSPTEIPESGSQIYLLTYFSFVVQ